MSEYWVSKKKYFCKYCDIYIADDAPSRQQHENGLRHKGNRDRFIRGLYKDGEKRKKDLEEEKREMARVELAAQAAFSQDVGAGIAKASAPAASSSSTSRKPPPKPSNPFANYSTAASLGYTDPDADRVEAETARRQTQGVAGQWEVIDSSQPQPTVPTPSETILKRAAEDENDVRQFKLRKKTLGTGLGQIYDPGLITLKSRKKEPTEISELGPGSSSTSFTNVTTVSATETPRATEMPKWTPLQWKQAGEKEIKDETVIADCTASSASPKPSINSATSIVSNESSVKAEDHTSVKPEIPSSPEFLAKAEPPDVSQVEGPSMFKKRKIPNVANRGRRQL